MNDFVRKVYQIGGEGADSVYVGVSFSPVECKHIDNHLILNAVGMLEPKLPYFRAFSISEFAELGADKEFADYDLCARLIFEQNSAIEKNSLKVDICNNNKNGTGAYLRAELAGPNLAQAEKASLEMRRAGKRIDNLESLFGRILNLAWSKKGNISIHGGATINEDEHEIYIIMSPLHGIGKTFSLLYRLGQGDEFVSNHLRCGISEDGRIFMYPQRYPKSDAFILVRGDKYRSLKNAESFDFKHAGIEELSEPIHPAALNDIQLKIKTFPEKIELTDEYDVYTLCPKVDIALDMDARVYSSRSSWETLYNSWEATWRLQSICNEFGMSGEAENLVNKALNDFYVRHINPNFLGSLHTRLSDKFVELVGSPCFRNPLLEFFGKRVTGDRKIDEFFPNNAPSGE